MLVEFKPKGPASAILPDSIHFTMVKQEKLLRKIRLYKIYYGKKKREYLLENYGGVAFVPVRGL